MVFLALPATPRWIVAGAMFVVHWKAWLQLQTVQSALLSLLPEGNHCQHKRLHKRGRPGLNLFLCIAIKSLTPIAHRETYAHATKKASQTAFRNGR